MSGETSSRNWSIHGCAEGLSLPFCGCRFFLFASWKSFRLAKESEHFNGNFSIVGKVMFFFDFQTVNSKVYYLYLWPISFSLTRLGML